MSDDRPWYREPETFIAVAALVVSISAVAVGIYEPLARIRRTLLPNPAFVLRFAVVFDFLEVAWRDPELIPRLLPPHWPGTKARRLARALYERLLPAAIAFGDSLRSDM